MSIKPRLSRGLRDLLPEAMMARYRLIETVRGVYETYGFFPIDTPAIEYLDVLSGSAGEEAQQSIFRVSCPEKEPLGLEQNDPASNPQFAVLAAALRAALKEWMGRQRDEKTVFNGP